jgi:hypothetical protein
MSDSVLGWSAGSRPNTGCNVVNRMWATRALRVVWQSHAEDALYNGCYVNNAAYAAYAIRSACYHSTSCGCHTAVPCLTAYFLGYPIGSSHAPGSCPGTTAPVGSRLLCCTHTRVGPFGSAPKQQQQQHQATPSALPKQYITLHYITYSTQQGEYTGGICSFEATTLRYCNCRRICTLL